MVSATARSFAEIAVGGEDMSAAVFAVVDEELFLVDVWSVFGTVGVRRGELYVCLMAVH